MSDQSLNLELSIPPYPEGAQMTPSEYAQWFVENVSFKATGSFLTGQVGGTPPTTSDIGLYVANRKIQVFDNAKYRTLLTVPLGTMLPWPCRLLTPPDTDYLFCDGQLILKNDYPDLSAVIGDTWKASGDDSIYFRLPDTRGRIPVGAGTGAYNPLGDTSIKSGDITNHNVGEYFGREWPLYQQAVQPNAPSGRFYYTPTGGNAASGQAYDGRVYTGVSNPSFVTRWLIRAK